MATITNATAETDVAQRIRARRRALDMTQRDVAIAAGCSLSMVGNLEAGAIPKHSDVLGRVLTVLDQAEAGD